MRFSAKEEQIFAGQHLTAFCQHHLTGVQVVWQCGSGRMLQLEANWRMVKGHVTLGLAAPIQQLQSNEDSPVKGVNMSHVAVSACKFSSHLYRELIPTVAQSK